jgi:hypothetical protein
VPLPLCAYLKLFTDLAFWHELSPAGEMCLAAAAAYVSLLANRWVLYHILALKSNEIEINVRDSILVVVNLSCRRLRLRKAGFPLRYNMKCFIGT